MYVPYLMKYKIHAGLQGTGPPSYKIAYLITKLFQPSLTHTSRTENDPLDWTALLGNNGGTWGECEAGNNLKVRSRGKVVFAGPL